MTIGIASVSLGYRTRDKIKALTGEQYAILRSIAADVELPENKEDADEWYRYDDRFVLTSEEIEQISGMGLPIQIHKVKGMVANLPGVNPIIQFHQVSVSNVGLFDVTDLQLMEDACTDAVQRELNDGWRIIAVCPPNDSRRPTYILGKRNG